MMGDGASKENIKKYAEVFTPPQTTFLMGLLPEVRDTLTDVDKPVYDPFVGQGQFPATWLVLRMFYNLDRLDDKLALRALYSLYGNDIQEQSVDECRAHMLATICEAYEFFTGKNFPAQCITYAAAIIERNFFVADTAKLWNIDMTGKPKKEKPPQDSQQLTLF